MGDESKANPIRNTNGVFIEITPTCVGDPYRDPDKIGRNNLSKPNFKSGKPNRFINGCFSPLITNAVGDPFVDKHQVLKAKRKPPTTRVMEPRKAFMPAGQIVAPVHEETSQIFAFSS